MFATKLGPLATLLILSWLTPHTVVLGIHAHEVLEHAHDEAAEPGLAVHAGGHDHELPSLAREIAPPVRMGQQKPAPSPVLTTMPPVLCLVLGNMVAAGARAAGPTGHREGPRLAILHCSFLI